MFIFVNTVGLRKQRSLHSHCMSQCCHAIFDMLLLLPTILTYLPSSNGWLYILPVVEKLVVSVSLNCSVFYCLFFTPNPISPCLRYRSLLISDCCVRTCKQKQTNRSWRIFYVWLSFWLAFFDRSNCFLEYLGDSTAFLLMKSLDAFLLFSYFSPPRINKLTWYHFSTRKLNRG